MSPDVAARRVVLDQIDEAREAAARMDDASDGEALHDLRVAIRRLRSRVRTFQIELRGSVGRKHRRALRDLQRATGGSRDAQVAIEWFGQQRESLGPNQRGDLDWLVGRLGERLDLAMFAVRNDIRPRFAALMRKLERRVAVVMVRVDLRQAPGTDRFATRLAGYLRDVMGLLAGCLRGVASVDDVERAHTARKLVKRLRYLVELAEGGGPGAALVLARCRRLQDLLGDLNDAVVQGALLDDAQLATSEPRAGLEELRSRLDGRLRDVMEQVCTRWTDTELEHLAASVEALASELGRSQGPPLEIERKYLLSGLPELDGRAEVRGIEQGYVPGSTIRERLRRVRDEQGCTVKRVRTVKLGRGVERIEVEELLDESLFKLLWPLTRSARVLKRRHRVPDGDLVWEIDEFLDRDLVLAEVELTSADQTVTFPAWLADLVVREVTDDGRYTNVMLADHGGVPE